MRRSEIFKKGSDLISNYRVDSGFVRHLDIIVYKIPALKKLTVWLMRGRKGN